MARKVGYIFGNETDLDNAILAGRLVRGANLTGGRVPSSSYQRPVFAKVDAGQSGYDVTATEVVWDSEANGGDGDWASPEGTAWRWNTTANDAGEDYTTTNLRSTTQLSANDVVEVVLYGDKSETTQWITRPSGGAPTTIIKIKSVDGDDYTADIIQGYLDETVLTANVTARIGSGDVSNNTAPINEIYNVISIEEEFGENIYFFQPPVIF